MNATAINQTTEIIPLVGYPLKQAGNGYHVGACPFCGGDDRFTVKHTRDGDRWHCRHCADDGYHSPIDYIMRRDNSDFKTALKTLGGDAMIPIPRASNPKPTPKPLTLPDSTWQAFALLDVGAASDVLLYHPQGEAAQIWLAARGLSVSTWEAWLLGFMLYSPKDKPQIQIPVITIPWYDMDAKGETITAVKYRVINNNSKLRYFSMGGSKFDLPFGLWGALPDTHHSLMLIEGELNCLSAWQCQPDGVSCLSFGSEGGSDTRVLNSLAGRYKNVYVWADDVWDNPKKATRAKELRSLVRGRGKILRSVKRDDVKQDANQLLKVGALDAFLSLVLDVECHGILARHLLPEVTHEKM